MKFLKDYFNLSAGERNGVLVLLAICIVLILFIQLMPYVMVPAGEDPADIEAFEREIADFEDQVETSPDIPEKTTIPAIEDSVKERTPAQANTVKDGKLWLNKASAEDFASVKGIGIAYATRIVDYRKQLGGFVNIEQVSEVKGIGIAKMKKLKARVEVDSLNIRKLNLNKAKKEELERHPYIDSLLAAEILAYRNQHGAFKSVENVQSLNLVNAQLYRKIAPYLKAE